MSEQLARIYNTLMLISTKGEDTIIMGQCLQALQELIKASAATAQATSTPEMESLDLKEVEE